MVEVVQEDKMVGLLQDGLLAGTLEQLEEVGAGAEVSPAPEFREIF